MLHSTRHRLSEARGLRGGVEHIPEFLQARFDTAPIGLPDERKQTPHFLTSFFDGAMEFVEVGNAGGRFQLPCNQFRELTVRFRAQFNKFRAFRPHDRSCFLST